MIKSFLLSFDSDGLSSSAGCLGVLTSHLQSPLVSQTSVTSNFEEPFDVFSQLCLEDVGGHLQIFAFFIISLPIEEPSRNSVSLWICD